MILLLASALASPQEEALTTFIRGALPAESPLLADNTFARNALTRDDKLDYAVPLAHFPPFELVKVVYMAAGVGPPGKVLEDLRVVHDTESHAFAVASMDWAASYRAAHPLDITALSDETLSTYLSEWVSLVRGADRWGFSVTSLDRDGRTVIVSFDQPDELGLGGLPSTHSETVVFTETGAVESWPFLQREHRPQ